MSAPTDDDFVPKEVPLAPPKPVVSAKQEKSFPPPRLAPKAKPKGKK